MSAIAVVYEVDQTAHVLDQGNRLMQQLSRFPCNTAQAWNKNNVFVGCHNQWITPESVGECNPYYDSERRLVISADAIIDNRIELFEALNVELGRRVQITDAELILLSYAKWGVESPKHLIGDFAFMIWDEREQRVFAARDFSGCRTLYYHWNGNRLAMCTTMKPLLELPDVHKRLNEQWMAQFLAISTVIDVVDVTQNVYKDILQLPPSHCMTLVNGQIKVMRYFKLTANKKLRFKTDEQYVEAFRDVFQQSVNARLRTYKQIGSQLSGGLDSGAVVSFAVKALRPINKEIHTFSYVPPSDFDDYTSRQTIANESPYINSTVQYVGGFQANYLDFKDRNSFSDIDPFLETLEMPYKFFENSFWIRGIFEQAAAKDIGILLTGARGNLSISWGDAFENYSRLLKRFRWIHLHNEVKAFSRNMGTGRGRVLSVLSKMAFPALSRLHINQEPSIGPIINSDFATKTKVFDQLREHGMDQTGWLVEQNIYKIRREHFENPLYWNATNTVTSKFSLPNALWSRDPSNDSRVIQFCLSVPEDQYVHKGLDRALIRRATENYLPDDVRLNQRVRGVQGLDWLHRIRPDWHLFIEEAESMSKDDRMMSLVDGNLVKGALLRFKKKVDSNLAEDEGLRALMRSVIVYRFLKRHF